MPIKGSLLSYENNNEQQLQHKPTVKRRNFFTQKFQAKQPKHNNNTTLNTSVTNSIVSTTGYNTNQQQQQQHMPSTTTGILSNTATAAATTTGIAAASAQQKLMNSKRKHAKYNNMHSSHHLHHHQHHMDQNNYLHLNSLWSIWYGVLLTLFQGYLAVHGAYRFIGCSLIQWKIEPVAELNLQIVLSGVVFILLPLFFTSAVFKVGNLANDGIKLATGSKGQRCSMSPNDGLEVESRGGTLRALWTHGGPTAAFVHIVIAMCLLLPRLLLEARIIENGLLPREQIWHTELDFIAVNRRNLVVLSVVTSPYQNTTNYIEDDEDYYNDTMFTAIGGNNLDGITGITNNYLETNTNANTNTKTKLLNGNGIGIGNGNGKSLDKTMFFEVPDLINKGKEAADDDIYDGEDIETDANNEWNRESIENSNSNEFMTQPTATRTTPIEITANVPTLSTQFTLSSSSSSSSSQPQMINKHFGIKNYDENWDKLAILDKDKGLNSRHGAAIQSTGMFTTSATITKTTADWGIGNKPITTATTRKLTTKVSPTTTTTRTTSTTPPTTLATSSTTTTTTTTTARPATTITKIGPTTTVWTTARHSSTHVPLSTQPTRTNHNNNNNNHNHHHHHNNSHHQHNHQHHHHANQNPNQRNNNGNQHHQSQHTGKSTRKHSATGRQRQRSQHNRNRHHNQHQHHHHQQQQQQFSTSSSARIPRIQTNSNEEIVDVPYRPATFTPSSKSNNNLNRFDELPKHRDTVYTSAGVSSSAAAADEEEDLEYDGRRFVQAKSTSTMSTTTRDSNIHIVKPEKLPEIIPSTPVSSNSKIIEIKTNAKRVKRLISLNPIINDDESHVEIEPEFLIGDMAINDVITETTATTAAKPSTTTITDDFSYESNENDTIATAIETKEQPTTSNSIARLDGFAGMLQIFFGIEKAIDVTAFAQPPSAEFVNLLFAMLVWCCRYPAVFWTTTKAFGCIFSIQMITAGLDIIFSYIGISTLYKLQIYSEAMPIQNSGLLLNGVITMALFLLSAILIIASSMIMYLYGHERLAAKMRDRSLITMKTTDTWIYFAHCASFCFVVSLAVVKAPLLNDLSATYKNNLHCATFLSALISVVHLLLWIVIWLVLTIKRRWTFKLPPIDTYGIITKASTQPLLMSSNRSIGSSIPSSGSSSNACVNNGLNSAIACNVNTTGNTTIGSATNCMGNGGNAIGTGMGPNNGNGHGNGVGSGSGNVCGNEQKMGILSTTSSTDGGCGDDIYWPKLTPSSPKLKVTFNEVTSTSDDVLLIGDHETHETDGKRHTARGTSVCFTSVTGEIDDGEYATLRAATAATVVGIGNGTGVVVKNKLLHLSEYDELPPPPPPQMMNSSAVGGIAAVGTSSSSGEDNISEEGKLLACVRDDSVTYASTRDLEPPQLGAIPPHAMPENYDDLSPTTTISSTTTLTATKFICSSSGGGGSSSVGGSSVGGSVGYSGRAPQAMPEIMQLSSSPEHLVSPLAPVTVTVHTNDAHIASNSTPRCLRRADSGVPNEALTPRSDTTSTTESTISPPERAPSETSSGVHSAEERDVEVVIRPRVACKPPPKPTQPPIQEEPYGRCTNMRMSSFTANDNSLARLANATNSATLPMQRTVPEQKLDYINHCSTMPLPQHNQVLHMPAHMGYSTSSAYSMLPQQQQQLQQQLQQHISSFKSQYANSSVAMAGANAAKLQQQLQHHQQQQQQQQGTAHTTLPNGVRYSTPHFLRRLPPHVTKAVSESPYGHLGMGAGHHAFSKLLHDPLQTYANNSILNSAIPEDRDSANYSMSSDQDNSLYATANHMQ